MPETMEAQPTLESQAPFAQVFQSLVEHAGAKLVYGDPVTAGGRTIVPVAKIRYGFGGGGGRKRDDRHGGGGGGGLVAKPVGVIEITASETRFVPIPSSWTLLAAVALGACLGWAVVEVAKG